MLTDWIRRVLGASLQQGTSKRKRTRRAAVGQFESLEERTLLSGVDTRPIPGVDLPVALADVHGGRPHTRIINGSRTSGYPSVGMVGDLNAFFCSGTLIAPRYVLTAAHCTDGVGDRNGRFKLGKTTYSTSRIFEHPGWNPSAIATDSANDIAIMRLSRDATAKPSEIFRGTPVIGQVVTLVGYGLGGNGRCGIRGRAARWHAPWFGGDSGSGGGGGGGSQCRSTRAGHSGAADRMRSEWFPGAGGSGGGGGGGGGSRNRFGIKRVGTTPLDDVTATLIWWLFENAQESNTAPGDSGGPAFVNVDGTLYIAGVTSGGTKPDASYGDHSFDTRVDAYAGWIDSIVSPAPDDHGNSCAAATTMTLDASGAGSAGGAVSYAGDEDHFQFTATLTTNATIDLRRFGSTVDTVLAVYDDGGRLLAFNDDSGGTTDSSVQLRLRAGRTYCVQASGYRTTTGNYVLSVIPS